MSLSTQALYDELTACQAKVQYERARNALAFNVLGASQWLRNQHGTVYLFPDGSWLAVSHTSNRIKYGPERGVAYAVRKLWDDRGQAVDRKSRMESPRPAS